MEASYLMMLYHQMEVLCSLYSNYTYRMGLPVPGLCSTNMEYLFESLQKMRRVMYFIEDFIGQTNEKFNSGHPSKQIRTLFY